MNPPTKTLSNLLSALFLAVFCLWPFLHSALYSEFNSAALTIFFIAGISILPNSSRNKDPLCASASTALGCYFIAVLLSILFSADFNDSLMKFYRYACGLIVFLVFSSFGPREKKTSLILMMISCLAVSFFALRWGLVVQPYAIEFLEHRHLTHTKAFEYLSRGRFFAPFFTPSALSGFIILLLPLGISKLIKSDINRHPAETRVSPKNILWLSSVIMASLALLATKSLGAFFALFLSLLIFLSVPKTLSKPRSIMILLIILLAFCAVFYLRYSLRFELNSPVYSITQRIFYWKQAISHIADHPFRGNGLGTFPLLMQCAPHNSFLQLWGESGIAGLLSFVFICCKTVSIRFKKPFLRENIVYSGLWIGNLAFLIQNLLDSNLFDLQVSVFWWAVAALLLNPDWLETRGTVKAGPDS